MDELALLKRSDGPVTRTRLARDLTALGLGDGDTVMFHTRMSAVGYVAGGPETVIGALRDVVGERGTLMVTCGWNDAPPYDFTDWPQTWQDARRAEHPAYDPVLSEADHNNGRLPEALRRRPGAVRSRHPDASFAALGAAATALTADHPWDDPHGPDSPLARLVAMGGRVLLLGAPLEALTLLHHAEALADAPGKRFVDYEQPILVDGERVWRRFHDIDSEDGAFDYSALVPEGTEAFEIIGRDMRAAGIGRRGTVGAADSHLFEARDVVDFGVAWMEEKLGRERGPGG
uniref:Aminoglycoside N(3)-acetyltransferase VII n=1 Tax=Streptomyces paromomycinus TaxID=92743 RepID=AACC7_STREY|nr:aminoglycoside N-acetyltransferase AAC(3)-VIIa [Streptomyces paromomycinus]P30180.1 RecName: Full=Aminoglycoside N(3)-acetyltransferase VII; AltName: Full=ACC(3)-VII; AltName: Full=Aminocyclitol 3-N-acetyltransferase type VII [Streptomyces paromomycinus]AAA88552.1 aminocyclitol 3-N-acetyltransferase type VII [Streptomyces paromomycinus]